MLSLTDQERGKFAAYLEQEAATTDGIIAQLKTLPNMEAIVKHRNAESMAMKIITRLLRKTETVTL